MSQENSTLKEILGDFDSIEKYKDFEREMNAYYSKIKCSRDDLERIQRTEPSSLIMDTRENISKLKASLRHHLLSSKHNSGITE